MEALGHLSQNKGNVFLGLIQALMSAQCALNPQLQYPNIYTEKLKDGDEFDYIVVGAGSAGSIVASRLSENENMRVLLLEAGKVPSTITEVPYMHILLHNSKEDWKYTTQPSDTACLASTSHQCFWPRGKAIGGSGSINRMLYLRGNRKDYEEWSENPGWDYDSLDKYFRKIEKVTFTENNKNNYGTEGKLTLIRNISKKPIRKVIINAAKELGKNFVEEESPLGYFDSLNNIDKGTRLSSAKAYLTKTHRSNYYIATDAMVASLDTSRTKKNRVVATGVKVKIRNEVLTLTATKEVVLSAGTINSPQILMNSGIGPREHLESLGIRVVRDLLVGENLQDHVWFAGGIILLNNNLTENYDLQEEAFKYLMHRNGLYASTDLLSFMGYINTQNNSEYPDIQLIHVPGTMSDKRIDSTMPILRIATILSKPKSRGKILLKSNDPYEKPYIFSGYLSEEEDLKTLIRGAHYVESLKDTETFKRFNVEVVQDDVPACESLKSDKYWECLIRHTISTGAHPVGTCKMGLKSDKTAVVDSKLRVYGVKNLRVIDASIMPVLTSVNTNGPTMMMAEKGADFIKDTWV